MKFFDGKTFFILFQSLWVELNYLHLDGDDFFSSIHVEEILENTCTIPFNPMDLKLNENFQ